jgi:predicted HD superfamily hydrolase involved in NAD metabolism
MNLSYDDLLVYLRHHLSEKRLRHSERVAETAMQLSGRFGVDPVKARLAGLVHDICREYAPDLLLQLAGKFDILVDDIEKAEPVLLHGFVGASFLSSQFAMDDPEILEAVSFHITGGKGIGKLAQLIFVADFLEPGRTFEAAVRLRENISRLTPEQILLRVYQRTIHYVVDQHYLIHPRSIGGWNELIRKGVTESGG